jgi:DeoR family glycerol-3-phosphate regulon repressor
VDSRVGKRQSQIVEIVRQNGKASVENLANKLEASRETIRRDLTELAKSGRVQKVHGGAVIGQVFGEGEIQERMSHQVDAKTGIAKLAASLFQPGETLFVDTGSTTQYFAEELGCRSGLTIVTNSIEIAKTVLAPPTGNRAYLLGGEFHLDNHQTAGSMAVTQIRAFRAHHAVLTIGALDTLSGLMDYNIEEAQVARAMIEQSKSLTVLADHSKFNQLASFEVCPLARIDALVCDTPPPDDIFRALVGAGCKIHSCQ